jgi:hypothetical protein
MIYANGIWRINMRYNLPDDFPERIHDYPDQDDLEKLIIAEEEENQCQQ